MDRCQKQLTSYNSSKKSFASKKKLKGTGVSITEIFAAKRMEQLRVEMRKEHGLTYVWITDGRILFNVQMKTKAIYFMIRN